MKKLQIFNRLTALVYDLMIQGVIALVVLIGFELLNDIYFHFDKNIKVIVYIAVYFVLFLIFFTIIPLKLKGTIGKYFADLKVVATNGKITFGRYLFRELILKYLYLYIGLALWVYFYDKIDNIYFIIYFLAGLFIQLLFIIIKRKPIHDYYLRTIVVKREENIE